jgi:hypothetical protein
MRVDSDFFAMEASLAFVFMMNASKVYVVQLAEFASRVPSRQVTSCLAESNVCLVHIAGYAQMIFNKPVVGQRK